MRCHQEAIQASRDPGNDADTGALPLVDFPILRIISARPVREGRRRA